jgi:hypothetical protein
MAAPLTWEDQQNQSSLPIKMEIAYNILLQPNKLSFDIAQIDRSINLLYRHVMLVINRLTAGERER